MARPRKVGLEYFPLDVDIFEDDKIFDVQNEYGPLGEVIYLRLICLIYKNGYYYRFESLDKLAAMLIKSIGNRWARDKQTVKDVILYLAKCNLFSSELMQNNVITSRGIQARYLKANERNLSKIEKYNLLENSESQEGLQTAPENPVNVAETPVNVAEIPVNVGNNPTKESKVKENKGKQSKVEPRSAPGAEITRSFLVDRYGETAVSRYEQRFVKWQAKSGAVVRNRWETIAKWLSEDNVQPVQDNSSFDESEVMESIKQKYKGGSE